MELRLRPATRADAELLGRWQQAPHVAEGVPEEYWAWEFELGREVDWREHLLAELDGRPVGFVQIIDPEREETHYWGDVPGGLRAIDIWIGEPEFLGRGLGTRMMQLALERCFRPPEVTAVLIDPLASNTRVHRFYERLGFRFVGQQQFGQDECHVYRLDRAEYESLRWASSQ